MTVDNEDTSQKSSNTHVLGQEVVTYNIKISAEKEVLEQGKKLAALEGKISSLELLISEATREHKNDIQELEAFRKKLSGEVKFDGGGVSEIKRLAEVTLEIQEKEDCFATKRKEYKNELRKAESQRSELAAQLLTGKESRSVLCTVIADYDTGEIISQDVDTAKIIHTRPMTMEERQIPLIKKPLVKEHDSANVH